MRFCTGKNSIILLTVLLCQVFLSYYTSFQATSSIFSGFVPGWSDAAFDCGLSASSGPAATGLENKNQGSSSGKIAQRLFALISILTRHFSEYFQSIRQENHTFKPGCSYWLIYCSIRR